MLRSAWRPIVGGVIVFQFGIGLQGCWDSGAGPSSPMPRDSSARPERRWFTEVTEAAGLTFVHESGARGLYRMPEVMGPGCALFDFDADGDLDIFLVNGNLALNGQGETGSPRDRLYRQDERGRFVDVADSSGLGDEGYGMGVAIGDIDNDSDLDVFITNFGPAHLYRNRGDGTFEDITIAAGIDVQGWTASAAFFDYDRDGFLDLYIARYVKVDLSRRCDDATGRIDYCGPQAFGYEPHVLLRNSGDSAQPRFLDVSERSGIASAAGPGLGVVVDDYDDDGWPDVAVSNDGEANFLWMNQRDGTFRERAVLMGFAYNMHGAAQAGMGIFSEDLDFDARPDVFITNLANQTNTLFRHLGAAGFEDATGGSGLGPAEPDLHRLRHGGGRRRM
jgi:hypothetical protein